MTERREQEPSLPAFVEGRPLTKSAFAYAAEVHGPQRRSADGAPFILHPLEVAVLLHAHGFDDSVTAAAVLHDALEQTHASAGELDERFGPRVTNLVEALTDDPGIEPGERRKASLRRQVEDAGAEAAAIFAADKVSKVRELRIRLAREPGYRDDPDAHSKLDHYRESLAMLDRALPHHPLGDQLRFELEAITALPPGTESS